MPFDPTTARAAFDPTTAMPYSVTSQPAVQATQAQAPGNPSSTGQGVALPQINTSQSLSQQSIAQDGGNAVDLINSAGGGIGQGIGRAIDATEGFGTDLARMGGIISPQTKANADQATQNFTSPNPITQDAASKFPGPYQDGKVVGELGAGALGVVALTALGAGIMTTESAAVVANGIIGSISSGNGGFNRVMGAAVGAGGTALFNKAASGIQSLANASIVQQTIKDTAGYFNSKIQGTPLQTVQQGIANLWNTAKATSDQLFTNFRTAPGDFSKEAYLLQGKILTTINQFDGRIDNAPMSVFQDALQKIKDASSIADLHEVRISLAQSTAAFNPSLVGKPVSVAFNNLRDNVEQTMQDVAEKAGVLPTYLQANNFYHTTIDPLQQMGADKIAAGVKVTQDAIQSKQQAVQQIQQLQQQGQQIPQQLIQQAQAPLPMKAAMAIKNTIDKFVKPNSPDTTKALMSALDPVSQNAVRAHVLNEAIDRAATPDITGNVGPLKLQQELLKLKGTYSEVFNTPESKAMIDGMQQTIQNASAALKLLPNPGSVKDVLLQLGTLGTIAGAGLSTMGAIPTIAGGAALMVGKSLLNTGTGQVLLKAIGTSSMGTQLLHQMITNGTSIGTGVAIDNYMKQVTAPPGDPELNPNSAQSNGGQSNGN